MTPDQARNEMLAVFKAAWDSTGFAAVYQDVKSSVPAQVSNLNVPWARIVVKHFDGGQTGFGATVEKRFTNTGVIWVQIFSPVGDGLTKAYELSQLVLVAFCQARGSVWFRNMRMKEVGVSGAFEQINVLADFNYDDRR